MATFFGEVLYPTSRAVDDFDYEESDIGRFQYNITYDPTNSSFDAKNVSCVVISHGNLSSEFVLAVVKAHRAKEVGVIYLERKMVEDDEDFTRAKLCKIFISDTGVLFCISSHEYDHPLSTQVAQQLLSLAHDSAPVVILCNYHSSKLQRTYAPINGLDCIIHTVKVNYTPKLEYPRLPQPATLDGLPAAVVTESMRGETTCLVYASFSDFFCTDSYDSVKKPFTGVLKSSPFCHLFTNLDAINLRADANIPCENVDRYL